MIYSRLKLVNKRLATTKYVDIVSNETVKQDFKDYMKEYIHFYGKNENRNTDLTTNGYGGLYFMPVKGEELYRKVVYAIEIHTFYIKKEEDIFSELFPDLQRTTKIYEKRRRLKEIHSKLVTLPPKITLVYLATYNNIGTKEKVKFNEPIITHEIFDNIEPGEKLPINPETANNLEEFNYNGTQMILLSDLFNIDLITIALNSPGYTL